MSAADSASSRGPRRSWRPGRIVVALAATVVLTLLCCGGTAAAYFFGGFAGAGTGGQDGANANLSACGQHADVTPDATLPDVAALDQDQVRNAAIIIRVGQDRKVPPRGWVIAIATALQESALHNLPNLGARNDHDSVGLFQQRPSTGWGTPAQILDPVYASTKFYEHLLTVGGWQALPLTVAAQDVQRSAYPDAYAKHEALATAVVNQLADGAGRAVGSLVSLQCTDPGQIAASGWTVPAAGRITSGFRTPSRPTHNGDDLAASRGTVIHAAADGVVTIVSCQAHTASGAPYSCDRDGSLAISGCGWWVEIEHAGNVLTRYCHLERSPMVVPGQRVTAGQPIGLVGMSGHATGPHCHFEVHTNGDESSAGAIDPVPFMNQQGAPLGVQP
jgi:murein DD-endopeptidase MepM/ murein hydrolase activator NlpD